MPTETPTGTATRRRRATKRIAGRVRRLTCRWLGHRWTEVPVDLAETAARILGCSTHPETGATPAAEQGLVGLQCRRCGAPHPKRGPVAAAQVRLLTMSPEERWQLMDRFRLDWSDVPPPTEGSMPLMVDSLQHLVDSDPQLAEYARRLNDQ